MAGVWLALNLLILLLSSTNCLDVSQIQVPTNYGISGVFLVQTKNNIYSFNATTAKEACEAIKMRIAKQAEVETANKNGLQTCRFGWVEEQIAVIPRIDQNEKCGKSAVGVSVWAADFSKKFDVYCFKPTGSAESFEPSSSFKPTTGGRTTSKHYYSTTTTHPSPIKSSSSPDSTSTILPPYISSPSISTDSSTSSTTSVPLSRSNISETNQTTSSPRRLSCPTTSPKFSTSLPLSSSHSSTHSSTHVLRQHFSSTTDQPVSSQTTTPNRPSITAAHKTIIIISVVLLFLLAAAGAAWYLKIKRNHRIPSWIRMKPKQINETEMWKQITERHCLPEQMSKDSTKSDNIVLLEQDPDSS